MIERALGHLRRHWPGLLAAFVLVLVPMLAFGEIGEEVLEKEPFPFEIPFMLWVHGHAGPVADGIATAFSIAGSGPAMIGAGAAIVLGLVRARPRLGAFAAIALGGSALLNVLMKAFFGRPRPALWVPILPENDLSFPSGHSMAAMALAATIAGALWTTRYRAPAIAGGLAWVLGMMASRVYIGVHYPTDVTAGALFSLAWVATAGMILRVHRAPA